jgi:hypothetical protein
MVDVQTIQFCFVATSFSISESRVSRLSVADEAVTHHLCFNVAAQLTIALLHAVIIWYSAQFR